jgi:hypothetical protein
MYKRLFRSVFIQDHGSNYRKLSKEEKKFAESNFFEGLKSKKSTFSFNKIRNFKSFFKELISEARVPLAKQVYSEIFLHEDRFVDNYAWMTDPKNNQELLNYLTFEFNYTEAILGSKWVLGKELFKELKSRVPEYKTQVVEKQGCKK